MKVGDLIKASNEVGGPRGIVIRIDKDYHGAHQPFKISNAGRTWIRTGGVGWIGRDPRRIRDRVLVLWLGGSMTRSYEESDMVEVISEGG